MAPASEGFPPDGRLRSHVAQCLACQAELARYNRLRRELGSLADVVEPAPPRLGAAVAHEINAGSGESPPSRRSPQVGRAAAAGGAVAAAAGAAAVIVWRHSKAAV
jgi:anti-sigma factor RsiW